LKPADREKPHTFLPSGRAINATAIHQRQEIHNRIPQRHWIHNTMPPPTDAEKQQRLKAALWYSVGQTIDSVSLAKDINATPHYIGALSEMLWGQIGTKDNFATNITKR
jgi:hypothetical protein